MFRWASRKGRYEVRKATLSPVSIFDTFRAVPGLFLEFLVIEASLSKVGSRR